LPTGKSVSVILRRNLLQFNGGLFADDSVLPVNGTQLGILKAAARLDWQHVEPAIFGTLLERALGGEGERHKLGAHFTPRAYVERLVLPQNSHATERHTAALRPACRSIPAARFRHSAELIGPTKVPLPFSFALRTATPLSLRAGWRKTLATRQRRHNITGTHENQDSKDFYHRDYSGMDGFALGLREQSR
jgi:hypothetical protein